MFGKEALSGRQLCEKLGVSITILYELLDNGLPFYQLTTTGRKYYNLSEVENWLPGARYRQKTIWTK